MSQYDLTITDQQWTLTLSPYPSAATPTWNTITGLANHIPFNTAPVSVPTVAGTFWWNDTDGTLDLRLKGGSVTLPLGQKQIVRVVNKTGTNLLAAQYKAVRVTGAQGQRLKVELARADNDLNSATAIGVAAENIDNNQEGFITTSGMVSGINTTGSLFGESWAAGDVLYLSPTTFGALTKVKPTAPQHLIVVGWVVNPAVNGSIFVKVDNGYELDELHNVNVLNPQGGQFLRYNSTIGVWENQTYSDTNGNMFYDISSAPVTSDSTTYVSVVQVTLPVGTYQIDAFISSAHVSAAGCKVRFSVSSDTDVTLSDVFGRPSVDVQAPVLLFDNYNNVSANAERQDTGATEYRRHLYGIIKVNTANTVVSLDYAQAVATPASPSTARKRSHIIARKIL